MSELPDPGSRAPFVVREYVRWGDVDIVGIIRYDAYLRFYQLAESELFRAAGLGYHETLERFGVTLPRKVMHAEFVSPPTLEEELEVRTWVDRVGTTSMRLNFDIYGLGGARRAFGHLVVVCVDARTLQKRPIPPEALARLAPWTIEAEPDVSGR